MCKVPGLLRALLGDQRVVAVQTATFAGQASLHLGHIDQRALKSTGEIELHAHGEAGEPGTRCAGELEVGILNASPTATELLVFSHQYQSIDVARDATIVLAAQPITATDRLHPLWYSRWS